MSAPAPRPGQGAERAAEKIRAMFMLGLPPPEGRTETRIISEIIQREAVAPMAEEVERLRDKNRALNERATKAEGLLDRSGLVEGRPQAGHGRSMGRALANYAAAKYQRERDALAEEVEALRGAIEWVLRDMSYAAPEMFYEKAAEWHARLKSALSRPGEGKEKGR